MVLVFTQGCGLGIVRVNVLVSSQTLLNGFPEFTLQPLHGKENKLCFFSD